MPRIKIKSVPKYWPGGPVGINPNMVSDLTSFAQNVQQNAPYEDVKAGRMADQPYYNPFDVKWGQQQVNPEINWGPVFSTGSTSHKPIDQFATSVNNSTTPSKGSLNLPQLVNTNILSQDKKADVSKKNGSGFFNTLGKINSGLSSFGPAASKLAMGLNYIDQTKEQKKYDQWQNRMLALSTPVDTSKNRGDYDQFGIFQPDKMGSKSKGMFANAYYPQENVAAFGMEVPSNMQPRYVSDVFTPSTYTAAPYIQHNNVPITAPESPSIPSESYSAPAAAPRKAANLVSLKGTDIATRTNNPGNLLYKPIFGKLFGAVDSGIKQIDGSGTFASFPDVESGLKAREAQMFGAVDGTFDTKIYKPTLTVDQALRKWSNNGYSGRIYPEIANKTLAEVTPEERRELLKRQIKAESGSMYKQLTNAGVLEEGGEPNKTNTMKIRIADVPSRKVRITGTPSKTIRITGTPDEQEMKMGGQSKSTNKYTGQSSGYGLNLGHRTVYADQPDNAYESASNTLQPVPRNQANIEAEKGETVYGDIDGDGQNEHMNIAGKRHVDGGTPLNVPEGTFIFSDTKKMRIKDPEILKVFGFTPNKEGYTPATIAKKYPINKYKAILEDPHTDMLSKLTAQKMIDNCEDKLAKLALIQESMKGFPQGIPDVAKKLVEKSQQSAGGQQQQKPNPGGPEPNGVQEYPEGQEPQQQSNEEEMAEGPEQQSPEEEQQEQPPTQRYGGGIRKMANGGPGDPLGIKQIIPQVSNYEQLPSWYKVWTQSNTKKGRTSPRGPLSTYNFVQGNPVYDDYQYWRKRHGRDFSGAADYQKYVFDEIQKGNPDAYKYMENKWGPTAAGRYDDAIMGARTMYMAGQRIPEGGGGDAADRFICSNGAVSQIAPGAPVPPMAQVYSSQAEAEAACSKKPDMSINTETPPPDKTVPEFTPTYAPKASGKWTQQDINSLIGAGAAGSLIKKYHPYRQYAQPVLPEFIPKDWRGYAATLTGQQNADLQTMANFQGGQGLGSAASALQGQRAGDLAKYISGTDEYNAQGATQTSAQRADILNKIGMYNKENLAKSVEDENVMDSKYKAALAAGLKGYVGALNQGITHAGQIANFNMTSPLFKINPRNQIMQFDPRGGYAAFMAQTQGGYTAPQTDGAAFSKTMKDMYDQLSYISNPKERQDAAERYAHAIHFGSKTSSVNYPSTPNKNKTTTVGYNPVDQLNMDFTSQT